MAARPRCRAGQPSEAAQCHSRMRPKPLVQRQPGVPALSSHPAAPSCCRHAAPRGADLLPAAGGHHRHRPHLVALLHSDHAGERLTRPPSGSWERLLGAPADGGSPCTRSRLPGLEKRAGTQSAQPLAAGLNRDLATPPHPSRALPSLAGQLQPACRYVKARRSRCWPRGACVAMGSSRRLRLQAFAGAACAETRPAGGRTHSCRAFPHRHCSHS